jgi:bacillithiol biosynthesis cysteine-adding enzyme BshC
MTIDTLPFESIPQFSGRDKAYTLQDPQLAHFYKYPVSLDTFRKVASDKAKDPIPRDLLVRVLEEQYRDLDNSPETAGNIRSLREDHTFTVVTAHQPTLFTGPLYFIYKIASTIHLARNIVQAFPDLHIVPVMILGGEDHDFEEMNHAVVFGKRIEWEAEAGGPVGRMPAHTLQPVLDELREILGDSEAARDLWERINRAFSPDVTYGRAMQRFVNDLFKAYGLVVLNMDHPELKRHFIPHMRRELLEQASQPLVLQSQAELEQLGFSAQAFVRPINLFYLPEGKRERIEREGQDFVVVNTDLRFSEAEMLAELEAHPERFSPNVVMRPLYQESILPNLAYIGGGGELAYWLERLRQFSEFGINFPMLIRRNSVLWIDNGSSKRMEKLGLNVQDLLGETEVLVKDWVHQRSEQELSLAQERTTLQSLFESIAQRTEAIDPTLVKAVLAEGAKQEKSLEQLEARLIKAQKQRFETELNQLRALKEKLFPANGLQERYENFIPYYLKHGDTYLDLLVQHLDPLKPGLTLITL